MSGIKSSDVLSNDVIPKLNTFKSALNNLIKTTNELKTANVQLAGSTGVTYDKNFARVIALTKQKESALRQLNNAYKDTDKSIKYNVRSLSSLAGASKTAQQQINSLNRSINESNTKTGILGNTFKKVGSYVITYFSIQGFIDLTKSIFETTKKLESLGLVLKTVSKSIEEQSVITGFLNEISNNFGLDLLSLTERFLKFKTAADQSNYSLSNTMKIYESVTKAGAVMGLSQHEIEGALLALEQMMSKGKVTTEELRRQLGERLPGAMGIMANALGVTIVELDKMLKAGEVLSADALPKFADALQKAYGIENVKNVDTLISKQNRLKNEWVLFIKQINEGDGALASFFATGFDNLRKWLHLLRTENSKNKEQFENISLDVSKTYKDQFYKELPTLMMSDYKIIEIAKEQIDKFTKSISLLSEEYNTNKKARDKYIEDNKYHLGSYEKINDVTNSYNKNLISINTQLGVRKGQIIALKGIISDLEKNNTPIIEDDKVIDKTSNINREPNYYNTKDQDTYHKKELMYLNEELNYLNEIANNKELDMKQRLEALDDIAIREKQIADFEAENSGQKLYLSHLEEVKEIKEADFKSEQERKDYLAKVDEKYMYDFENIYEELRIKKNNIDAKYIKEKMKVVKDGSDLQLRMEEATLKASETQEMINLNNQYKAGLINKEDYEKEKKRITEYYLAQTLQLQIDALFAELDAMDYVTDEDWIRIKNKIDELRKQMSELGMPDDADGQKEKIKKYWNDIKDIIVEIVDNIGTVVDNMYQQNIDSLEAYKTKKMEFYDKEYELAEGDAVAQKLIKEEKEREEKKIDARIRKEKIKQAKADKAFASFNIMIGTAEAVVNALKTKLPYPMPQILAAMYGALGMAQLAAVNSRPIPQYKKGTGYHKGGFAIVGDGGSAEVVVEPNKQPYLTPDKSTLTYLEKGSKVYPSIKDFNKASINTSLILANNKLSGKDAELILNMEIEKQIKNGFKGVKISNNNNIKVNNSLSDYYYKKLNTQF